MSNTVFSGIAAFCPRGACKSLASLLLAFSAMAFLFTGPISVAQDSKTPAVLPAPSSGKAIVCIYRTYRFTGSSSHDELYVNGTHLAKLLNSEYAFMEVPAGTVVISGLPKEYYGSVIMSAMAAANQARQKENERARFEAEAGKTYYFKWTSGAWQLGSRSRLWIPRREPKRSANSISPSPLTTRKKRNQERRTTRNRQQTNIASADCELSVNVRDRT